MVSHVGPFRLMPVAIRPPFLWSCSVQSTPTLYGHTLGETLHVYGFCAFSELTLKSFLPVQCRTCNSNACGIYIKSRGHHRWALFRTTVMCHGFSHAQQAVKRGRLVLLPSLSGSTYSNRYGGMVRNVCNTCAHNRRPLLLVPGPWTSSVRSSTTCSASRRMAAGKGYYSTTHECALTVWSSQGSELPHCVWPHAPGTTPKGTVPQ